MTMATNPTLWLDVIVGLCLGSSIVFGILTSQIDPGPRRGRLKLLANLAFSAVFLLSGLDTILTRHLSAHFFSTGVITTLEQHGGKNAYSKLVVTTPDGANFHLWMDTNSRLLQTGEKVRAEEIAYSGRAIRVDILDGANRGQHLKDTSEVSGFICIAVGIVFAVVSGLQYRSNPNGNPTKRTPEQPPLNGIDEDSLLRLNKP
jgi:hypothetical protein